MAVKAISQMFGCLRLNQHATQFVQTMGNRNRSGRWRDSEQIDKLKCFTWAGHDSTLPPHPHLCTLVATKLAAQLAWKQKHWTWTRAVCLIRFPRELAALMTAIVWPSQFHCLHCFPLRSVRPTHLKEITFRQCCEMWGDGQFYFSMHSFVMLFNANQVWSSYAIFRLKKNTHSHTFTF